MIAFWPRGDRIRVRITAKPSQATVNFQRALWIVVDRDHMPRSHAPFGGSIDAPAFGFRPMRIAVQQQPQSASAMTWQESRQGDRWLLLLQRSWKSQSAMASLFMLTVAVVNGNEILR